MDLVFFWCSKIFWMLGSPDHLLVLMLLSALILLFRNRYILAKIIFFLSLTAILLITLIPIGDLLLAPLEKRFPVQKKIPSDIDGIMALAGAENIYHSFIWNQTELNASSERLIAFMQLIKQYPDLEHMFVGGTGSLTRQEYKSTTIAKKLFEEFGINTRNMLFEHDSKNTYENAVYSYNLAKPKEEEKWLLITSASHMPRAVGVFRKAGWNVIAYPVDHTVLKTDNFHFNFNFSGNLKKLTHASRAWVGLAMYYLTGKTNELLPAP